ncbi:MAG: DNA polymerase III subunit beta [Victivallaceae bacterium]|nr:DNA polymerase III subunit beta [Victivallaceae bacterium]
MKFKVEREKFHRALGRVGNMTNNRAILPLLNNVLLECEDGKLKLTTTDLELRMSTEIEAEVIETGKTTAPAKKLNSLISCMSGAEVEIEADELDHVKLKCGTGKFTLLGLPAKDFPEAAENMTDHVVSIKEKTIRKMISSINYAVSADDSRKVLTGVLMSLKETNMTLVATDGKRMAIQEGAPESIEGGDADAIIPLRAINELRRVAESDETMKIFIGEKQCVFKGGDFELSSKLIEGNYPNYRQVVPTSFTREIEIPTDLLKSRIQTMSLLLPDTNSFIILGFSENQLQVSASSSEVGEGSDTIDIQYSDESFEISFNPQFLIEPLVNTDVESVRIKVNDPINPVAMEAGEGFLYVIMPIRKK